MTAHLPPALLKLFEPRPPMPHISVVQKKQLPPYTGLGDYLSKFEQEPPKPQKSIKKRVENFNLKVEESQDNEPHYF